MNKGKSFLMFLTAVVLQISCQKEVTDSQDVTNQSNQSKLILQKSDGVTPASDQSPFVIHSAGVYQGYLYMSVSFTGGQKAHEFTVNWDGSIVNDGEKKEIELVVFHQDVHDPGTSTLADSISANILTLGITSEVLNDPLLWIRVTNGNDADNSFYFKVTSEYIDPVSVTYTRDVTVIKEGCSDYGIWGDLWLVTNDAGPASHYFVMALDNSVSYTPVENDKFQVNFNYTYLTDSSKVCTQLNQFKARPVKITRITR